MKAQGQDRGGTVRRWAPALAALVPAYVVAAYVIDGAVPGPIRAEAALVLIVAMARPVLGLILVGALAPLGDAVVPLLGSQPVHHAETLVVAFLAGWLSSRAVNNETSSSLPDTLAAAMWVFGAVIVASVATNALHLYRESPQLLHDTLTVLSRSYLLTGDMIGAHAGAALVEGVGLIAAAADIADREPRRRLWLLLTLIAAGVFASVASGLLAIGVAPAGTVARQLTVGLPRYSAVNADVNATASCYLLLLGASVGLAASVRRTQAAWLLAAGVMLGGVVLTGSAAALMAVAVVVCGLGVLWIVFAASGRWRMVAALVLAAVLVGAIGFVRTPRSMSSLQMRSGFTQASLHMIEARPVFGVGAGRYYSMSRLVLPPPLAWAYGLENAHDYYLQIAAELGVVGVVAFVWVIGAAVIPAIARMWRDRDRGVTAGMVGGVAAYLVTALAGHPFLVQETVVPFWIVLGLLATPTTTRASPTRWRNAAIAFGCVLLLTVPLRPGVPPLRLAGGEDGFGPSRTDEEGRSFREADNFASLFVGPTVTSLEMPVRARTSPGVGPPTLGVAVPGWPQRQTTVVGPQWSTLIVALPGAEPLVPRQRINLFVDSSSASAHAAVEVGQIKIVTTR